MYVPTELECAARIPLFQISPDHLIRRLTLSLDQHGQEYGHKRRRRGAMKEWAGARGWIPLPRFVVVTRSRLLTGRRASRRLVGLLS